MKNASNRTIILGQASQKPETDDTNLTTGISDLFRFGVPGPLSLYGNGVLRVAGSYIYRDRIDTPGDTLIADIMAWDLRNASFDPDGDGGPNFPELLFAPPVASIPFLWDGTSYTRQAVAGAASLAADPVVGALLVTEPGEWTEFLEPAVAVVATITRAAGGAAERHVCKGISGHCAAASGAPSGLVFLRLRDGAAGAGAILWSGVMDAVAGTTVMVNLSGLNILGSLATAMTLEFSAAPGAGAQQTVTLTGITVG